MKQWYNSSHHAQEDVGEEEDYSAYEDGWQHEDDYFRYKMLMNLSDIHST